jgi:hypothetical protein
VTAVTTGIEEDAKTLLQEALDNLSSKTKAIRVTKVSAEWVVREGRLVAKTTIELEPDGH